MLKMHGSLSAGYGIETEYGEVIFFTVEVTCQSGVRITLRTP